MVELGYVGDQLAVAAGMRVIEQEPQTLVYVQPVISQISAYE